MSTINIKNLSYTYTISKKKSIEALRNVSFDVENGEIVSIIGQSGCGKSTLLQLISGLLPIQDGEIQIDYKTVKKPDASKILMYQSPNLLPWLTVKENILFYFNIQKKLRYDQQLFEEIIDQLEIGNYLSLYPPALSAGISQRVILARSILPMPKILLLDESFSNLDYLTQKKLVEFLRLIWEKYRFTLVLVTHDIHEALSLTNKIILMTGTPGTVFESYQVPFEFPRNLNSRELQEIMEQIVSKMKLSIHKRGEL